MHMNLACLLLPPCISAINSFWNIHSIKINKHKLSRLNLFKIPPMRLLSFMKLLASDSYLSPPLFGGYVGCGLFLSSYIHINADQRMSEDLGINIHRKK